MIRAAIIGLGDISPVHLNAIRAIPGAELVAGCDTDPERRPLLPDGVPFYISYAEMLEREQIDVVHLCLPHHLHFPAGREVAEKGFHVFTEKPLAMDGREAADFAALEAACGVKIGVCLQNRLNDTSQKLLELLAEGACGAVTGVTGLVTWCRTKEYYDAKPWRASLALAGGGVMMNQAIHTLDLVQHFAMSPVKSIRGSIGGLLDIGLEVEDTACAQITFAGGATGLFMATVANSVDSDVVIEVRCERAAFVIRDKRLYKKEDGVFTQLAEDDNATAGKACYGNSHQKLIERFYRAVENGTDDYIHAAEGVISVKMIEAIRGSAGTNQTIIWEE